MMAGREVAVVALSEIRHESDLGPLTKKRPRSFLKERFSFFTLEKISSESLGGKKIRFDLDLIYFICSRPQVVFLGPKADAY